MAATIIDQLVVEFGLDPKNFTQNQKTMLEQLRKLKQAGQETTKSYDEFAEKVGTAFESVATKGAAMFAALVGANSIEEFVAGTVKMETALGRSSKTIGLSASALLGWRNISEQAGGSAEGMEGSIRGLSQELQFFAMTGRSNLLPFLRAMHIDAVDLRTGAVKPLNETLLEMADWAKTVGPTRANALFAQMGFSPDLINVLVQGRKAVQEQLDRQAAMLKNINSQADAAERLTKKWNDASQAVNNYLRNVLAIGSPVAEKVLDKITAGLAPVDDDKRLQLEEAAAGRPLTDDELRKAGLSKFIKKRSPRRPSIFDKPGGAVATTTGPAAMTGALPPEAVSLLNDIAGSESGGRYNALYGKNRNFGSDYSRHPNYAAPITSGPNKGRTSSAAGRYQMLFGTWQDAAKALGLKDFSPENQDKAAWYIAQRDYKKQTGRDLLADLKSRDPTTLAQVAQVLSKTWTSLPGGIEQTQGMQRFISSILSGSSGMTTGAAAAVPSALAGSTAGTTDLSKTDIQIGQITIVTQAKDAKGIARDIGPAIRQSGLGNNSNYGPN